MPRKAVSCSIRRRLFAILLTANLFVAGLVSVSLLNSHQTHDRMAVVAAENLSQVLQQSLDGLLDKIDLSILAVLDELDRQTRSGGLQDELINAFLARQDLRLPEAFGLRITNDKGIVTHAVTNVASPLADMSRSATFLHSSTTTDPNLFIGEPIDSPLTHKISLGFSRRWVLPDGQFAGQVHVGMSVERLQSSFGMIDLDQHGSVTLTDQQGRVLARYPNPAGEMALVTNPTILPTLHALISQGKTEGSYSTLSAVDGIERSYYFRKIGHYPVHILVGIAHQDYLQGWQQELRVMTALSVLFLVVSSATAWLWWRSWRQRQTAGLEMARKDADLALFRQGVGAADGPFRRGS